MKKIIMFCMAVVMTMAVSAQNESVKISAKYQKGDHMLYHNNVVSNINGKTYTSTSDIHYKIIEATDQGYTVESKVENFKTNASTNDLSGRLMNAIQEVLNNMTYVYNTDADGKIIGIKNLEEVKAKSVEASEKIIESIIAELPPESSQIISKDMLKSTLDEQLTEENIISYQANAPSPFTMNGKVIKNGATETFYSDNGMKIKNTYTLLEPDGSKVRETGVLDMTKEEMKRMVVEEMKKIMPEQVNEEIIDKMLESGALKMEKTQTSYYEFAPSGWAKKIVYSLNFKNAGQSTETSGTIILAEGE